MRWADIVADYNFKITYCLETVNIVTDTLIRKYSELVTQKEKDIAAYTQLFLDSGHVIACIKEGLLNNKQSSDSQVKLTESPYQLVNQILQANQSHESLNQYCQMARKEEQG